MAVAVVLGRDSLKDVLLCSVRRVICFCRKLELEAWVYYLGKKPVRLMV